MRSRLGLVGNTLHVDGPSWERLDGGIGAGIDSYYEYLLKVCPKTLTSLKPCSPYAGIEFCYDYLLKV